jgi:hypothetical protein
MDIDIMLKTALSSEETPDSELVNKIKQTNRIKKTHYEKSTPISDNK